MSTARSRLSSALRRFARARDGNVAITFAIAIIPLLAFVGAAIDYTHANAVRASMQSAVDATGLMISNQASSLSDVSENGQPSDLDAKVTSIFKSLFTRTEATNVTVNATYSTTGGTNVEITAKANVPTTFLGIVGYNTIAVGVSSTAKWGSARLRVALVLDNTGSMSSSGKLTALQTATKNLLTQLKNAASVDGDVYVSIIPFVKDVAVGTSNSSATWIDWSATQPLNSSGNVNVPSSSTGPGSSCPYSSRNDGYTCVTQAGGSTTTSTIPSSGSNKGYICPSTSIGCYDSVAVTNTTTQVVSTGKNASCSGYSNCTCTGSGKNKVCSQTVTTTTYNHTWFVDKTKWNGCITDRGNSSGPVSDYDRLATEPTTSIPETLFPAEQYSACPQPMMGLSYDWTGMNTLVTNMVANGSTNQPIGLVWGWQSLVGGGPFTVPVMDSSYTYSQIIILLSDGLNTQDRWYGNGSSTSTQVDDRMYELERQRHLRQHQGGRHHDLHDPGQHKPRPHFGAAAELRHRRKQVLPADLGKPDSDHVRDHRDQPHQAESGEIDDRARQRKSPASTSRACRLTRAKRSRYATLLNAPKRFISPSASWLRTACRSPWRGRHTSRRSWSPWPRSLHKRSWRIRTAARSPCPAT